MWKIYSGVFELKQDSAGQKCDAPSRLIATAKCRRQTPSPNTAALFLRTTSHLLLNLILTNLAYRHIPQPSSAMWHLAPTSERPSEMHGPTPLGFLRSRIALPIRDSFASRRLSIWFVDPESQISSIFLSGLTASPVVRPRPDHRISFVASSLDNGLFSQPVPGRYTCPRQCPLGGSHVQGSRLAGCLE
jgi:hypothetical protein